MNMLKALLNDEQGFIVSAELVLIATIVVIGLVVGLSEVQHSLVSELNDVADAIGSLNQSYAFSGFAASKTNGCGSASAGSGFGDTTDDCDNNSNSLACARPTGETVAR